MSDSVGNPEATTRSVSVLTPRGRSAVAVVRVQSEPELLDGPPALFQAANGRPVARQPIDRVCYGRWGNDPGEDVVVCRIAPGIAEVSCHGGVSAVARIVRDLEDRGCKSVDMRDSGRVDAAAIAAESVAALTRAPTLRTAAILLEQDSGLLERAIDGLQTALGSELTARIDELLRWAEFGRHLTRPWQVGLFGLPNVGKSSLMNALLGYGRSIVYSEPGTTRDVVTAVTAFDGWPVELCDTAGLRDAAGDVEAEGVLRARRQADAVDLPIIVLDRSRPVTGDERQLIAGTPRALVVANKSDLPGSWSDDDSFDAIHLSSLTGAGVDALAARIAWTLVPLAPRSGTAIPLTERQVAGLESARTAALAGDAATACEHLCRCQSGRLENLSAAPAQR